jgi:hypothetical protein
LQSALQPKKSAGSSLQAQKKLTQQKRERTAALSALQPLTVVSVDDAHNDSRFKVSCSVWVFWIKRLTTWTVEARGSFPAERTLALRTDHVQRCIPPGSTRGHPMLNTEKGFLAERTNENPIHTIHQSTDAHQRARVPWVMHRTSSGPRAWNQRKTKSSFVRRSGWGLAVSCSPPLAGSRKQSPMHRCGAPGPTWFAKIGCRRLRVSSRV